jgi:outer membrane lipoprotein-sorting protein
MTPGWRLCLAAGLIGWLTGCAPVTRSITRVPKQELRHASLEEVLAAHESYCEGLKSLSAAGDLTVADLRAGRSHTIDVRLAARRDGQLYLKGSVAVVTVLELVSDGERAWFRIPRKKRVWTGSARAAAPTEPAAQGETTDDEAAPYEALRPYDLTAALLPERLAPAADDSLVFEADERTFSLALVKLEQGRGRVSRRVWLDRATLQLSRTRHYDASGDLVSETRFMAWKDGWPRRVSVTRADEGYVASFVFSKLRPNASVPDRAFEPVIPDDHTVAEID